MRTVDPVKHAFQRQAVLAAARACFMRDGFHRTSTEAIRIEAGTSSGKLFHYFPNKKAIILAVVEDQSRQTASWMESLRRQPQFPAALTAFLDGILHLASDAGERRLILEIAAEGARDADVAAASMTGDRLLEEGLAALLLDATARGQAHPLIPADHAVRFLMVLVDGIFSRVAVDGNFDPMAERAALATVIRAIFGIDATDRDA